jgi:hypothetical protein
MPYSRRTLPVVIVGALLTLGACARQGGQAGATPDTTATDSSRSAKASGDTTATDTNP